MSLNSKSCLSFGEERQENIKIFEKCRDGHNNCNHVSKDDGDDNNNNNNNN